MEDSCQICRHIPNAQFDGGAKKCMENLRTLLFDHFDAMALSYNAMTLKNRTLQQKVDSMKEEVRELRGHLELRGFSDVEQTESDASSVQSLHLSPTAFRSPTHDPTDDDEDGGAVKASEYVRTPRVFERSDDSHVSDFCVPDDSFRKRGKRYLSLRSRPLKRSQQRASNRKNDAFKRDVSSSFDDRETMLDTMLELTPSNPSVVIVDKPKEIISIDTTFDCSGIWPKAKRQSPAGTQSPIKIKVERPSPVKGSPLRMCQPSAYRMPLRNQGNGRDKSFPGPDAKTRRAAAAKQMRSPDEVKPIVGSFRQGFKAKEENRNWCDNCLRLRREVRDPELLQHHLRSCGKCCNIDFKDMPRNFSPIKSRRAEIDQQTHSPDENRKWCDNCLRLKREVGDPDLLQRELDKCWTCSYNDFEATPRDFWNPHLQSFDTEDPRNETLEDNRFVGLQRKGKYGSFK